MMTPYDRFQLSTPPIVLESPEEMEDPGKFEMTRFSLLKWPGGGDNNLLLGMQIEIKLPQFAASVTDESTPNDIDALGQSLRALLEDEPGPFRFVGCEFGVMLQLARRGNNVLVTGRTMLFPFSECLDRVSVETVAQCCDRVGAIGTLHFAFYVHREDLSKPLAAVDALLFQLRSHL